MRTCSLILLQWGAVVNAVLIIIGNVHLYSRTNCKHHASKTNRKPVAVNCYSANGGTVEAEEFGFPCCDTTLFSAFNWFL